jgi:hypothetical protein
MSGSPAEFDATTASMSNSLNHCEGKKMDIVLLLWCLCGVAGNLYWCDRACNGAWMWAFGLICAAAMPAALILGPLTIPAGIFSMWLTKK